MASAVSLMCFGISALATALLLYATINCLRAKGWSFAAGCFAFALVFAGLAATHYEAFQEGKLAHMDDR
ncbi:hypothetical protein [Sphingomonas sp.]|uniref:hypothetical protein n=1 Tax=Sphingomonas sp. TaxID=28214 RepID=UPI0035C7EEBD